MEIIKKKLSSGNLQIRFSLNGFYGYLLAEENLKDSEILDKIYRHLDDMKFPERYFQRNLFSMATSNLQSGRVLIFREHASSIAA